MTEIQGHLQPIQKDQKKANFEEKIAVGRINEHWLEVKQCPPSNWKINGKINYSA